MKKQTRKVTAGVLTAALILLLAAKAVAVTGNTGYQDVAENDWYAEAVQDMTDRTLINGTGNDLFTPNGTLTRAMLATVFYRMAGEPEVTGEDAFTDTTSETWYSDAVLWANEVGYVQGYGNGRFGTADPVTQEQLAFL